MPLLTLPDASTLALSVRAKALVFEDPESVALLERIRELATGDATVLINGETGTGKELIARYVHELSARREGPFLAVNCAGFAEGLADSELFGHEKGAFPGATAAKAGWLEAAHGGTLFLDEVGDLSPAVQRKLLHVLEARESSRIGSQETTPVLVRLIVASNLNLEIAVAAGHFLAELLEKIGRVTLTVAPLRERPGDILPLARHFLEVHRERLGLGPKALSHEAAQRLLEHAWPGNILELENAVHHALLLCHGPSITPGDLRLTTVAPKLTRNNDQPSLESVLLELFNENVPNLFEHIERVVMRTAFQHCARNQLQTARLLGISRNVVRARLIQFGEIPGVLRPSRTKPAEAYPPSEAAARI